VRYLAAAEKPLSWPLHGGRCPLRAQFRASGLCDGVPVLIRLL